METNVNTMDQKTIEEKALSYPAQAQAVQVVDQVSLTAANDMLVGIKAMRKQVDAVFDPIIKKAHEAHKEAIAQKKKVEKPLAEAEGLVKKQVGTYLAELERKRQEEERKKREEEEAKRKAEEERLRQAIEAEENGNKAEAEAILEEVAVEENTPAEDQPIEHAKPDMEGVSYKERWKWEYVNKDLIPEEFMMMVPDESKINYAVRTMKGKTNIPGIRVFNDPIISARATKTW